MSIKTLTVSDTILNGGAAIAHNRITQSLESFSDTYVVTSESNSAQTSKSTILFLGKKHQLLEQLCYSFFLNKRQIKALTDREWCRQFTRILNQENPDVINIHNLHSATWPITMVETALRHAPVVWTLHDCWSFLGAYYSLHSMPPENSTFHQMESFWERLKKNKNRLQLSAIAPSEWMKGQAMAHSWKDYHVERIHNAIPDSFFKRMNRRHCKKALGLSDSKPVVLCIAGNLQDNRKGSVFLKKLNSSGLIEKAQFVYIGAGHLEHFSHSSTLALGFLRDELSLQIAYCAADLLIHPALIDNLPNTVAESMGCGTPALSYAVGGLPDMVVPHKSGWLVRELDVDSMLQTLDSLLSGNALSQIRESTRAHAKSLFSTRIVGDQYKSHFISYLTKE